MRHARWNTEGGVRRCGIGASARRCRGGVAKDRASPSPSPSTTTRVARPVDRAFGRIPCRAQGWFRY
ncbi:hypothetical protein A33K_16688 [Burkholderia humptydooensis MSMB43]|uniref:Uncharacterized protein n=1 Tax=Burkholderia humptydooensis MSMB43 TaxID=441157 RepID=A0ABN0G4M0_9BURK|nr:hypothetical protein A33K_16688 [Burkholderia humptydooensis MSMB43]